MFPTYFLISLLGYDSGDLTGIRGWLEWVGLQPCPRQRSPFYMSGNFICSASRPLILHHLLLISNWVTGMSYQPKNPVSSSGAKTSFYISFLNSMS